MSDAEVIDLTVKRRAREEGPTMPVTSTPAWRAPCRHDGITVDEAGGVVECKHCGERLEPLAALLIVARNGNQWAGAIESARAELKATTAKRDELQREVKRLAARRRSLTKGEVGASVVFSVDRSAEGFEVQATHAGQSTGVVVKDSLEGVVDSVRVALGAWSRRA